MRLNLPTCLLLTLLAAPTVPSSSSELRPWTEHKQQTGSDGFWRQVYWYQVGVPEIHPTGVIFDSSRQQLVFFTQDRIRLQLIGYDPQRRVAGIHNWPAIPYLYSAIYDPRRDRIVVLTADSLWFNMGTFALSLRNPGQWERLVPFGASPNLGYASAIYDPEGDRMILYGGTDFSPGYQARDESWSLSLGDHARWTLLEPRGKSPPPRLNHTAIYDEAHHSMVVYGGETARFGPVLGDAWSLELGPKLRWRQVKIHGEVPVGRTRHTTVYDSRRHRMVTLGGRSGRIWGFDLADIWALSLEGAPSWRRLNPSGEQPPAPSELYAFADPAADRMILTSYTGSLLWILGWGGDLHAPIRKVEPEFQPMPDKPVQSRATEFSLGVYPPTWRGRPFTARVSLPMTSEAKLDLFDAEGRKLWTANPRDLGIGSHDVTIAPTTRIPAGVYFLRLEQGEQSVSAKVVRVP